MKRMWIIITLALVFFVSSMGLTGCKKKEKPIEKNTVQAVQDDAKDVEHPTEHPAAEEAKDAEHPASEHPDAEKPRDHPAH